MIKATTLGSGGASGGADESRQAARPTGFSAGGRSAMGAFHPFVRLERLLRGREPGAHGVAGVEGPLLLQVGDPKAPPPTMLAETIAANSAGWGGYPPPRGTPDYKKAAAGWALRRFGLPAGFLDPEANILPVPGTREGLFFAITTAIPGPGESEKRKVLIPSPFFHVYAGASVAASGEPLFLPAGPETGFLPDYAALPRKVLDQVAVAILCSPSNPQGAVASREQIAGLIALARRHGFLAIFDECYSELYFDGPPPGALQLAAESGSLDNVMVFHSLSKRSSAPGLRCGFMAGDAGWIDRFDGALRFGGAGVPVPVQAAGAALWRDEAHVEANRAFYARNFDIAERVLGNRFGFRRPAGGFFLWLDVGDGEAAAIKLWEEAGIRVLPGAYMCVADAEGNNPGQPYIRVALVHDAAYVEAALEKLVACLAA
ncbi:aminotransferase class I/II-fold pyridoxal phosphate-dependent enzyme [Limibacillus halophilus]